MVRSSKSLLWRLLQRIGTRSVAGRTCPRCLSNGFSFHVLASGSMPMVWPRVEISAWKHQVTAVRELEVILLGSWGEL